MSFTVKRTDYVRRSQIHLKCTECGTTTIRCHIDDASIYEDGMREHVCRLSALGEAPERSALRRMFRHMAGGAL